MRPMELEPVSQWLKTMKREMKEARLGYYRRLAEVINDHPQLSIETLTKELGVTAWAMQQAIKLAGIQRPSGTKSAAYKAGE